MSAKFDCLITEVTRNHAGLTFGVELVHEADQGRMLALIGNELLKRKISCTIDIGKAKPRTTMIIDRWSEGMMTYCLPEDVEKLEAINAGLLEALEWIAKQYDDSKPIVQCASDAYAMSAWARAAIAKAKGEGV